MVTSHRGPAWCHHTIVTCHVDSRYTGQAPANDCIIDQQQVITEHAGRWTIGSAEQAADS